MSAKKRHGGIVYSTNSDFQYSDNGPSGQETLSPGKQDLRVHLQSLKGNKKLSIVRGFSGSDEDIKILGKKLKSACGVGGSVKDDEILIQGDQRDKILKILLDKGYKVKKAGG